MAPQPTLTLIYGNRAKAPLQKSHDRSKSRSALRYAWLNCFLHRCGNSEEVEKVQITEYFLLNSVSFILMAQMNC